MYIDDAENLKERNELIVKKYIELAQNDPSGARKSTVVFTNTVNQCKGIRNEFIENKINAMYIIGSMGLNMREYVIREFESKRCPVLINCGVLTEGIDIPNIDCLIIASPTKSPCRFIQMVGRGVRLSKGKKNCLVIDFFNHFTGIKILSPHDALAFKEKKSTSPKDKKDESKDEKNYTEKSRKKVDVSVKSQNYCNPYSVFTYNSEQLDEMQKQFGLGWSNIFKNSYIDSDTFTCGSLVVSNLSKLAWTALNDNLYVLQSSNDLIFIERVISKVKPPFSYNAYYQTVTSLADNFFNSNSPKIPIDIGIDSESLSKALSAVDKFVFSKYSDGEAKNLLRICPFRKSKVKQIQKNMLIELGYPKKILDRETGTLDNNITKENYREPDPNSADPNFESDEQSNSSSIKNSNLSKFYGAEIQNISKLITNNFKKIMSLKNLYNYPAFRYFIKEKKDIEIQTFSFDGLGRELTEKELYDLGVTENIKLDNGTAQNLILKMLYKLRKNKQLLY
ncbi:hypothetical protein BB561_000993 [Smittium simulii]|uniref:Helicase C-terminal domain-containing protein n=1 Tax=Smittium simulii TaxID=133385 RepID=A0A2T9YWQ7_9FUNG|nr:hypothetical protein BB561_000993 [Smittium simulii]